ncbi:MAG TPA: hypothetical protein VF809_00755 [Candidatus Saccharimonadales bacterium]
MKYFLGFLATVGLMILVLILVLRGFSGDSSGKDIKPLSDYANTNAVMQMTVDGPIIAEQQHQAYRITVGNSETRIETLQGYDYEIIETKTYENNQQSYTNFLRALDIVGYSKGITKIDTQSDDERGVCATGNRMIFGIVNGTSKIQRYWSTTCGGGTFKGNREKVKQLFDRQIPSQDFSKMTGRLRV